ncbi:MAG: T9SS type A sorting domain-containing protein [Bacteroidetes bacterium]|nr:T9SS type A sorting domain-containing protein [Bacteroidota bacterium]
MSQGNSVYISGQFSDTLNLNPQAGTSFLFEHFADNLNNFNDSYLVKYTNSGTFVWGESFGGNLYDRSKVLAGAGISLYHAGEFSDTADFNNGPVNQTLIFNGVGNFNIFIQKFAQPVTSVLNLNKQEGYYVFPSPSKGEIYFSSSLVRDFSSYSVRSIDGKIILSGETIETKLNMQKCLSGIYIIEFSDKTKGKIVMRFIID